MVLDGQIQHDVWAFRNYLTYDGAVFASEGIQKRLMMDGGPLDICIVDRKNDNRKITPKMIAEGYR
jgi:hypothetical protein